MTFEKKKKLSKVRWNKRTVCCHFTGWHCDPTHTWVK